MTLALIKNLRLSVFICGCFYNFFGGFVMKCPKCGYVSFEYLDTCRKCGRDLTQFKSDMGITTFVPGVINVLKYVEGMEEAVEKTDESAVATATSEEAEESGTATAVEEAIKSVVEKPSLNVKAQEKSEIEISLPEEITEPKLEAAEASSAASTGEKKEEISLTIEEEPKIEEPVSIEPEMKESPVEELTLSLEDIAELGEEGKSKKKEGDEIKLELE